MGDATSLANTVLIVLACVVGFLLFVVGIKAIDYRPDTPWWRRRKP